jgi:hypothetical protein
MIRAAAMALFGDLVATMVGRELSGLRTHVYQSMVPLLLHLKDQCPAVATVSAHCWRGRLTGLHLSLGWGDRCQWGHLRVQTSLGSRGSGYPHCSPRPLPPPHLHACTHTHTCTHLYANTCTQHSEDLLSVWARPVLLCSASSVSQCLMVGLTELAPPCAQPAPKELSESYTQPSSGVHWGRSAGP